MMDLNAAAADVQELVEVVGRSAAVVVMMPPAKGPASDAIATLFASMKAKQVRGVRGVLLQLNSMCCWGYNRVS